MVYDAEGNAVDYIFEDCNAMMEDRLRRNRADLLHRRVSEIWPDLRAPFLGYFSKVVATQRPVEFEARSHLTGRDLRVAAMPLGGDRFATISTDITERKSAEAALRCEKALTDAVMDSVPGMLYIYDADGFLVHWNKQHELLTGYSAEELSHMHVLDWYDEQWKPVIAEGIRVCLEGARLLPSRCC
jgi:PAS domain-containing protein